MTERFGLSHRQVVKDVNAGNVVAPTKAVTSGRGIHGRRDDVRTEGADHTSNTISALVNTGNALAGKINEEQDRKKAIEGYNLAGTEEGRRQVDARSASFRNKVFGPDAGMRAAQERIVRDSTDDMATALYSFLDKEGARLPEDEWQAHVATQLSEKLGVYEDKGIKDQITARFGQNLSAVAQQREKKHDEFVQFESRETHINSVNKQFEMSQLDLESGDPARQGHAKQRAVEAFKRPEGMTEEAWQSANLQIIMNGLDNKKPLAYEVAKQGGIIEAMTEDQKMDLQASKDSYDAVNVEGQIRAANEIEYAAGRGDEVQTVKMVNALLAQNPAALDHMGGKEAVLTKAFNSQMAMQEAAVIRERNANSYLSGDRGVSALPKVEQQAAGNDALSDIAEEGIRKQALAAFQDGSGPDPKDMDITPRMETDHLIDNAGSWARQWASSGVVLTKVTNLGNQVLRDIGNPNLTPEGASKLGNRIDSIMVLQKENPGLLAKHFEASEVALLNTLHQAIRVEGQDPFEEMARQQQILNDVRLGKVHKPQGADRVDSKIDDVVDAFTQQHGEEKWGLFSKEPENVKDLRQWARQHYEEEYARTGDSTIAKNYAIARLNKGSTQIGNKFVLGGGRLDKESVNGNFDAYLQGVNDDPETRKRMTSLDEKTGAGYGLPEDFDLRDDSHRIEIAPDGKSVVVWIEVEVSSNTNSIGAGSKHARTNVFGNNAETVERAVFIPVPTKMSQIMPTKNAQRLDAARKAMMFVASGGRVAE